MNLFYLFFAFFLVFSPITFAQKQVKDSLEVSFESAKEDSNKVLLAYQLAWKFLDSEPEKSKLYASAGLEVARKAHFTRGEVILLNRLGDYHYRQGNYDLGVNYATQSLKIAEKIKNISGMADAYVLMSIIYSSGLRQYDWALEYSLKALDFHQQDKNKNGMAATYNLIANIYTHTKKDFVNAHQYSEKAIAIARELRFDSFLGWCLNIRGTIYDNEGKLDSALTYFEQSNLSYQKANDMLGIASNAIYIGDIYLKQRKLANAKNTYQQAIPRIQKLNAKPLLQGAYRGLAKVYGAQKQYDSAFNYQSLYADLKDTLLNEQTTQKIALIQKAYEQEQQNVKIALLEKEKQLAEEGKYTYTIIFIVCVLTFLVILLIIIRNNQQKRKVNQLLQEKNAEIASQNKNLQQSHEEIAIQRDIVAGQNIKLQEVNTTKDKLFSIVSHDLRSPIGSLRNLLSLIATDKVTPAEFDLFFPKLNRSVENIHDMLDNILNWSYSQMGGIKNTPNYLTINELIKNNINLFADIAKNKSIEIVQEMSQDYTVFADENQLKLILRNLASNALKFTKKGGKITFDTLQNGEMIEISVADTGVGMDSNQLKNLFQISTNFTTYGTQGEKGTGLGLLLCKEMVEKNGGKIWVESKEDLGSKFIFSLPTNTI